MNVTIRMSVDVVHNPQSNTGDCVCTPIMDVTDANGNKTSLVYPTYSASDIGLSPANQATLDTILTTIRNAAITKFKNDIAASQLG